MNGVTADKLMMQRINAVKERLLGNQAHIRGVPSM